MMVATHPIGDKKQPEGRVSVVGIFVARPTQADVRSVSVFDHGCSMRASHASMKQHILVVTARSLAYDSRLA